MATVKVKFRASAIPGKEGTIYYQIIHQRRVKQIFTHYRLREEEWNHQKSTIKTEIFSKRRNFLKGVREGVRWDIERIKRIIFRLSVKKQEYTLKEIYDEYVASKEIDSLFNYMESRITKLKEIGKTRTSETYTTVLNGFRRFREDMDVPLDSIDCELVESYEAYLSGRGLTPNSISFHMRILRAVYNRAVDDELVEQRHPFKRVYTGIEKTKKRALDLKSIRKIREADLSRDMKGAYARDMFMLSFFLRGMSFVDMAYLRKSDLNNGMVTYRRRKTGQKLIIQWTTEMQAILEKYPANPTSFLLPIITNEGADSRNQYKKKQFQINNGLKKLGKAIGLPIPLTAYVARHSWASIAKSQGIPLCIIQDGLGHNTELTTQIYLSTLDTSAVDRANASILKSLSGKE